MGKRTVMTNRKHHTRLLVRIFGRLVVFVVLLMGMQVVVVQPSALANTTLFQAAKSGDESLVVQLLENARQESLDFSQCWDAENCTSGSYSGGLLSGYCWDKRRSSALHVAAEEGHARIVQLLLDAGFDPNIPDRYAGDKFGPIYSAAYGGHADVILALYQAGAKLEAKDQVCPSGAVVTPLHRAARKGNTKAIMMLIALGANPAPRDINGATPLHKAADMGHRNAAAALLAVGVDPNVQTQSGNTPLHNATRARNSAAVPTLLDAGANPNQTDEAGHFPLIGSTKRNDVDAVKALLFYGANVNVSDEHANTALHFATKGRSMKFIGLLLCYGADPYARNKDGTTPVSFAKSQKWTTMVKLLKAGCKGIMGVERIR